MKETAWSFEPARLLTFLHNALSFITAQWLDAQNCAQSACCFGASSVAAVVCLFFSYQSDVVKAWTALRVKLATYANAEDTRQDNKHLSPTVASYNSAGDEVGLFWSSHTWQVFSSCYMLSVVVGWYIGLIFWQFTRS